MDNTCTDGGHYICAHCAYEWPAANASTAAAADAATAIVRDANGNTFAGAGTAASGKELALNGLSITFKMDPTVKRIRLAGGRIEACGWFRAQGVLSEASMSGVRS